MRILIAGAAGQLGHALCGAARAQGHEVQACTREELDVTDARSVERALVGAPELVFNCSAWNDVDGAERDPAPAFAINHTGAAQLAVFPRLVHFSTDYVFDGASRVPYREEDRPAPLNRYGESKLAGERAVLAEGRHFVVRTSWLFGARGKNFVKTVLNPPEGFRVVTDQTSCPTGVRHLAEVALRLATGRAAPGLYHCCDGPPATWFSFCETILRRAGLSRAVVPVTDAELGRAARRPAYSVLDCSKIAAALGGLPYRWEDELEEMLRDGV